MNGSTGVWIFAVVAVVIVAAFGASLYWAGRGKNGAPRRQSVLLALSVPLAVGGLYAVRGEPAALNQQAAPATQAAPQASQAPQGMTQANAPKGHDGADMGGEVQKLADRLKKQPGDLDGWILLANSYNTMGNYAGAADAFEHAQARVMKDSVMLTSWIEARVMANNQKFDARTLQLVDAAVKLSPNDTSVLELQAMASFSRGDMTGGKALLGKLYQRYPAGSNERKDLETAFAQWVPPQQGGASVWVPQGAAAKQ